MEDKTRYFSIFEFAKKAGVSRQCVYRRINGDLCGFCKVIDGVKMVDSEALSLFDKTVVSSREEYINALSAEVNVLRGQLKQAAEERVSYLSHFSVELLKQNMCISRLEKQVQELNKKVGGLVAEFLKTDGLENESRLDEEELTEIDFAVIKPFDLNGWRKKE